MSDLYLKTTRGSALPVVLFWLRGTRDLQNILKKLSNCENSAVMKATNLLTDYANAGTLRTDATAVRHLSDQESHVKSAHRTLRADWTVFRQLPALR